MDRIYTRVTLAETFGWSLEYIDQLSEDDLLQIFGVKAGVQRAAKRRQKPKRR